MLAQIIFKIFTTTYIKLHKLDKLKPFLNICTLKRGLHLERFDPSQLLVDRLLRWIYAGCSSMSFVVSVYVSL